MNPAVEPVPAMGQSLQGRPSGKSDHVGYAPQKRKSIQSFSGFAISYRGLMDTPET